MKIKIDDFMSGEIWGILPDSLDGIVEQYFHNREFLIKNYENYEAATSRRNGNESEPAYEVVENGIAILPIIGAISKRDDFWSLIFGDSTVESITRDFKSAVADSSVSSIVLNIDSPGGTIGGIESLSSLISENSLIKPVVAYGDGLLASAAYWIGSGATKIIAESTALVGSIGVMTVHYDFSKAEEMYGLKRTYLTAGKYKALGNESEPLSTFAKEYIQERLDYFYTMFVNSVAENRNTDADTVLKDMADGKIFIGKQAQDVGLIDGVGQLEDAIELAGKLADTKKEMFSLNFETKGVSKMKFKTIEEMVSAYPEFCEQLFKQGVDSIDTATLSTTAIKTEQDRIFGFVGAFMGEASGKKFQQIIESGITADQYKIVAPEKPETAADDTEKDLKATLLAAIKGGGAEDPGRDNSAGTESGKDFLTLVAEYQGARNCKKTEAMQAVMQAHPEKHEAYLKSVN